MEWGGEGERKKRSGEERKKGAKKGERRGREEWRKRKGTGERRDRKERRKDTHEETQGYTDAHRCTRIERNIYRQVGT